MATALADAAAKGAHVRIVYDAASSYKAANNKAIDDAGLRAFAIKRTVTEGIRHNKFMVLFKDGIPQSGWTGSTNISPGGIFGHSNVGHVVHDRDVAQQFYDWERLSENKTPLHMRAPNAELLPLPDLPLAAGVTPIFSPREDKNTPQADRTLQWYADRAGEAQRMICFTAAFNIAEEFQEVSRPKVTPSATSSRTILCLRVRTSGSTRT